MNVQTKNFLGFPQVLSECSGNSQLTTSWNPDMCRHVDSFAAVYQTRHGKIAPVFGPA